MMIVILSHERSGGEDCVIMKVSLNTLSAIHLPLGHSRLVLTDTQPDGENYAADCPTLHHEQRDPDARGSAAPGEASCGFADKLFHTEQSVTGLPLRLGGRNQGCQR